MIYKFSILNEFDRSKIMYLSADTLSQFYRRVSSTYGISKDRVTLIAEYEPETFDKLKVVKEHIKETKHSKTTISKSQEIWNKLSKKCEPYKSEAIAKYGYTEIPVSSEVELRDLVKKYKKVKVYWERKVARGPKTIYALVK